MPELPEVETVCRGLAKALAGARIMSAKMHRPDLRVPFPKDLAQRLKGKRVVGVTRRAKYILINLDSHETLLLHLGMSGRMVVRSGKDRESTIGKHDHLILSFDKEREVRFNDPRRFGMCDLVTTADLAQHKFLRHLGVEPLESEFTAAFLTTKLKAKNTSIKTALLDQRLVVGVGNIYACEALFYAGINPKRLASSCHKYECTKLVPAIHKVLNAAIKAGGSSLRDYVQSDGGLGYFQHQFAVYGREGQPCPGCDCDLAKTKGIKRIAQGGRSSFYCTIKQK